MGVKLRTAEKISVIVPVYNVAPYLEDCLKSLTEQSYKNLEILLIDDGSTDGSEGICRQWSSKDGRIRLLTQENAGVSSARNAGLDAATGEYVVFVDGDDWLEPRMMEWLAEALERTQSDLAACGFRRVYEADRKKLRAGRRFREEGNEATCAQISGRECIQEDAQYVTQYLLQGNTRCWGCLYRREMIGEERFRKGLTIGEDMLFLVDLLPRLRRAVILDKIGYDYYINEKGAMFGGFKPAYLDQLTCWEIARECIGAVYPEALVQVDAILTMAALLTAGKLALLNSPERRKNAGYVKKCRETVEKAAKSREVRRLLSSGYKVKSFLFLKAPWFYMTAYHLWKSVSGFMKNRKG